jgi:hypothetical protein
MEAVKIMLLLALISAIAAVSRRRRPSPERPT